MSVIVIVFVVVVVVFVVVVVGLVVMVVEKRLRNKFEFYEEGNVSVIGPQMSSP